MNSTGHNPEGRFSFAGDGKSDNPPLLLPLYRARKFKTNDV
jgi:hypothetical protein